MTTKGVTSESQGGWLIPPEVGARVLEVADRIVDWRFEKIGESEDGKLSTWAIILIWPSGQETGLWEDGA